MLPTALTIKDKNYIVFELFGNNGNNDNNVDAATTDINDEINENANKKIRRLVNKIYSLVTWRLLACLI